MMFRLDNTLAVCRFCGQFFPTRPRLGQHYKDFPDHKLPKGQITDEAKGIVTRRALNPMPQHLGKRSLVRVRPQAIPGWSWGHYGRGRLISVDGDYAYVKPLGRGRHREVVRHKLSDLRPWRSGFDSVVAVKGGSFVLPVTEDKFIIVDKTNWRAFAGHGNFYPELSRAKIYTGDGAATGAMKRMAQYGPGCDLAVLLVEDAERLWQEHFHPASPEPAQPATSGQQMVDSTACAPPSPAMLQAGEFDPDKLREMSHAAKDLADKLDTYRMAKDDYEESLARWKAIAG